MDKVLTYPLLLVACVALAWAGLAQAQPRLSPEAEAYLEDALTILEENFIRQQEVDWEGLRREAFETAAGAQTPADTHPAIRQAVGRLGEPHTSFVAPAPGTGEPGPRATGSSLRS